MSPSCYSVLVGVAFKQLFDDVCGAFQAIRRSNPGLGFFGCTSIADVAQQLHQGDTNPLRRKLLQREHLGDAQPFEASCYCGLKRLSE